ncbi:hypothetical protein RB195_013897 [Necator americanus]|uniref:Uncharacterized protein n=1 Tax=Necator americanus TaxID=51031 RepID=A0ABR1DY89_NECAM
MSGATPDLAIYDPVSNFTHGFLHQIRGMLPPKKNMWEETPQSRGTEIVLRLILSSLSCYSDVGDGEAAVANLRPCNGYQYRSSELQQLERGNVQLLANDSSILPLR